MKKSFYTSLSNKYREKEIEALSEREIEAYLIARFPATYAVAVKVLQEVSKRISCHIASFLDLGAGPGTGFLAAKEIFPNLTRATLIEQNKFMIEKRLETLDAEWIKGNILDVDFKQHDLALCCYSFGEISEAFQIQLLEKIWKNANVIVIIEPGTPKGFEGISRAREVLLQWGGHMIAPCPHSQECPMRQKKDWCHFSVRIERSREHRHLKGGTLGWEDEKFSYLAIGKEKAVLACDRLIGHPRVHPGHVILPLCSQGEKTISKKDKELYKKAKKAKWGDEGSFQ